MGDIKSAREIAMERIKKIGEATEEERMAWRYIPEGEKLAARYLRQDCNLSVELNQNDEAVRKYIAKGANDVLVRNIDLPRNDSTRTGNQRAMEGLKTLKTDKVDVENVFSKIRRIFDHYTEQGEQQRRQAYESLKNEFEAKLQQAVQQQLGSVTGIKLDVENQPQFQEEWRKVQTQLDSQYFKLLDEYKQELSGVA